MTKYFYTNSLDAFYMEQKWGVKYRGKIGKFGIYVTPKSGVITVDDHLRLTDKWPVEMAFIIQPDEPDTKWVVHEDSVHLFKAQMGDILFWPELPSLLQIAKPDNEYNKRFKIIQRNNTAFIMPEVEHD